MARQGYDAVMAGEPVRITGGVNKAVALAVRYVPQWLVQHGRPPDGEELSEDLKT